MKIKKYLKHLKIIFYILILTLILTILNLIFIIPSKINKVICLLGIIIYVFLTSIKHGQKIEKKAYKEGLKQGLITCLILITLSLITLSFKITISKITYYIIIIITSILGTIIGINKKH